MDASTITSAFKTVSITFAIAAVTTGLQALTSPVSFATSFGIPLSQHGRSQKPKAPPNAEAGVNLAYIKVMGARQFATGITLLVFAYQGKWVEMATVLVIVGSIVAGMDGYQIAQNGSLGGGLFHAVPGWLIAALATAMLRYS